MTWIDYVLIGWIALGALLTVGQIGKPRKPTTPDIAVSVPVIDAAIIAAMLWAHGVIA